MADKGKFLQGLVENERVMLRPRVFHGVRASRMHSTCGKAEAISERTGEHALLLKHDGSVGVATVLSVRKYPSNPHGCQTLSWHPRVPSRKTEFVLCMEARPEIIHPTPNELGLGTRPGHRA